MIVFYAGLKIEVGYIQSTREYQFIIFSSSYNVIIAYGPKRSIVNVQEPEIMIIIIDV